MPVLRWKIAGAAGEGIKAAGLMMNKTLLRSGFFTHGYTEYPSLIRGGHNSYQIAISTEPVQGAFEFQDVIIALNDNALSVEKNHLTQTGKIFGQNAGLPLVDLAREINQPLAKNTIALGASCFLLNLDLKILLELIKANFIKKGESIVKFNQQGAEAGYQFAAANLKPLPRLQPGSTKDYLVLSGNEALGLGAVAGGMKYYSAYPMTPMSSLLHFLAKHQRELGLVVHHAEDEIGVINMAIGVAHAGVRAMVATSGGGFSLMAEGLGLTGVSETPLVIGLGMRPGPASGMPTWSGQGDLLFAINASQDEFPRIVLSPGNPQQCFELGKLAQNLAEKYQLPVIIVTDKNLGESEYTVARFKGEHLNSRFALADSTSRDNNLPFPRYQLSETGISPRPLPGQSGGVSLANSYEHDELGYATESAATRTAQVTKRAQKLQSLISSGDLIPPQVYGPKIAKTSLICWGSTLGALLTVLPELSDTNLIHFSWVWPFPEAAFMALIKPGQRLVTVENNHGGQLAKLIRQETGIQVQAQVKQWDGRPFFIESLPERLTHA